MNLITFLITVAKELLYGSSVFALYAALSVLLSHTPSAFHYTSDKYLPQSLIMPLYYI